MSSYEKLSESIAKELTYTGEEGILEDTVRLNEYLTEFNIGMEEKAKEIEDEMINQINKYFNDLVNEIVKNNLSINLNSFNRHKNEVIKSIRGKIKNHMSKKVSMDNEECMKILSLKPGDIKKTSMSIFIRYSFYEAIKNFKLDSEKVMDYQKKNISELIGSKLCNLRSYLENSNRFLSGLEEEEVDSSKTKDALIAKINEKMEVYDEIIRLLE